MPEHVHVPDEHQRVVPATGTVEFVPTKVAASVQPTPVHTYPLENESLIDILVPCRNRLAFTRESLSVLLRTTDWPLVRHLWLYDDQSEDGTGEYLDEAGRRFNSHGVPTTVRHGKYNSPLGVLTACIKDNPCGRIAKVDNDALMPIGWLGIANSVLTLNPTIDLLGLGYRSALAPDLYMGPFTVTPSRFIGGIGSGRSPCGTTTTDSGTVSIRLTCR